MLLFVAGVSPQIITETAYALLREQSRTEDLYVLTTAAGAAKIRKDLLGPSGKWTRFRAAYPRARRFRFRKSNVIVLRDAAGDPLFDVRSAADNIAAADQIASFVERSTRRGSPPVHASIAGGRKTMGYLLAAAMMLYGRREDRLSHVLVHPPELEGTSFFFPPPDTRKPVSVRTPAGRRVTIPVADIRIELAELPFPRLGFLEGVRDLSRSSFNDMVRTVQTQLDLLAEPQLQVDPTRGCIRCREIEVSFPPVRAAIYSMLAARRKSHLGGYPCSGCSTCFVPAGEIGRSFREQLSSRMRQQQSPGVGTSWGMKNFMPEVAKINETLRSVLGSASKVYEIARIGSRGNLAYGLAIPPQAISFVHAAAVGTEC